MASTVTDPTNPMFRGSHYRDEFSKDKQEAAVSIAMNAAMKQDVIAKQADAANIVLPPYVVACMSSASVVFNNREKMEKHQAELESSIASLESITVEQTIHEVNTACGILIGEMNELVQAQAQATKAFSAEIAPFVKDPKSIEEAKYRKKFCFSFDDEIKDTVQSNSSKLDAAVNTALTSARAAAAKRRAAEAAAEAARVEAARIEAVRAEEAKAAEAKLAEAKDAMRRAASAKVFTPEIVTRTPLAINTVACNATTSSSSSSAPRAPVSSMSASLAFTPASVSSASISDAVLANSSVSAFINEHFSTLEKQVSRMADQQAMIIAKLDVLLKRQYVDGDAMETDEKENSIPSNKRRSADAAASSSSSSSSSKSAKKQRS